jgi:hypothetical protein
MKNESKQLTNTRRALCKRLRFLSENKERIANRRTNNAEGNRLLNVLNDLVYWKNIATRAKPYRFTDFDCLNCMTSLLQKLSIQIVINHEQLELLGHEYFNDQIKRTPLF